jgi:hypothetical protein
MSTNSEKQQTLMHLSGTELGSIDNIKEFRKTATQYYQNHIQGKIVNHKDLGEIKFTKAGRKEVVSKKTHNAVLFPVLLMLIENSIYIRTENPYHNRIDGIIRFHFLVNTVKIDGITRNYEFLIAEDTFDKRFYYIKNVPDSLADRKVPGATEDTCIITDGDKNFNP